MRVKMSFATVVIVLLTFGIAFAATTGFQNLLVKGTLAVIGASTFTGAVTNSSTVHNVGAVTNDSTLTQTGNATFGSTTTTQWRNGRLRQVAGSRTVQFTPVSTTVGWVFKGTRL